MNHIDYVTEYEYGAAALLLVLLGLYLIRRRFHTITNAIFFVMIVLTFGSVAFHIITTTTLPIAHNLPLGLNYFFHLGYLLIYNMIGVIYLMYVLSVTKYNKVNKVDKGIVAGLMLYYIIVLITTPFTKLIVYFDENMNYCHGSLFYLLPGMSIIVFVYSIVLFIKYRKKLKLSQIGSVITFMSLTFFAAIIQLIFPTQIISNFAISLSLLVIFISLENPSDYIDISTDCMNREAFYIILKDLLWRQKKCVVAAFRPEGLNYIIDHIGVNESKRICSIIAKNLKNYLNTKELFYLGNWKFAIIDCKKDQTEENLLNQLNSFFQTAVSIKGQDMVITPYICTLSYPDFVQTVEDFRDAIDYTLKEMKEKNIVNAKANSTAIVAKKRELQILTCIKQCIYNHSFEVYYQPIYDMKEKKFKSAEALIRMKDDELGYISPDEFIPLAEANGLIIEIGELVFREVCQFIQSESFKELGVDYIEVNLSVIQCVEEKLADVFMNIMEEYHIQPNTINFEITGTAGSANYEVLLNNMKQLIEYGVSFSMDDYGIGFSNTNYLMTLPTEFVKIDKSILWSAMENKESFIILKHMVEMLRSLKKQIIIEGVETLEMVNALSKIGCDYLQGYYYSRPVPKEKFIAFLEENKNGE